MKNKEYYGDLISKLIAEDVHLCLSQDTLFLVGAVSMLRGSLDNILDLGEDACILITLYPEVSVINPDVVDKVIKTGKSAYWSYDHGCWL